MKGERTITRLRPRGRTLLSGVALAAAVLTAGCATTADEDIAALRTAESQYQRATRTARIDEFGSQSMQQAEQNLRRAQALAEEGGDVDEIEHYSFLAQRHVEIAEARLNRGVIQEEIEDADRRRQELMLASQRRQSERSQTQASQAQERAEEAEARLALTQQELDQTQQAAQGLAAELDDLKVKQEERGTVFTLSDVVFDVDSDELNSGGERSVARIAQTLKKYPKGHILVEGYTDSTGSDDYNADLSERRAKAVKAAFVKEGIPDDRVRIEGYGEEYPVANNDTPQGRQMNRRVEIVVSDDDRPVAPRDS